MLYDVVPTATTHVSDSAAASSGVVTDASGIGWTGNVTPNQPVAITFQVTVNEGVFIANTAIVTDAYGTPFNLVAWANARHLYLPRVLRNY